jgi:hypothetical protein
VYARIQLKAGIQAKRVSEEGLSFIFACAQWVAVFRFNVILTPTAGFH